MLIDRPIVILVEDKRGLINLYVCMYVCMYVYMYVCMYVCMYICMCVCMYVYIQCTYVCTYYYIHTNNYILTIFDVFSLSTVSYFDSNSSSSTLNTPL